MCFMCLNALSLACTKQFLGLNVFSESSISLTSHTNDCDSIIFILVQATPKVCKALRFNLHIEKVSNVEIDVAQVPYPNR